VSTRHFTEPKSGRALLRVAAGEFSALPEAIGSSLGRFVLFVAGDTLQDPQTGLVDTASKLLRSGAVAVHCWGPDAGRLETCFDMAAIELFQPKDPVIMTSSSEGGDLEDAMWEGIVATYPANGLDEGYERVVLAIVGSQALVDQADAYLAAGVPLRDEA